MHPEAIDEAEIQAYMDDELDLRRRLAVEDYLAANPVAAQHLMAHLRMRTSLRLLAGNMEDTPAAMRDAAVRLSGRLPSAAGRGLRDLFAARVVKGLAAASLLLIVGLPIRDVTASPPDYVGDAVKAYRTGLLRAQMTSQVETPHIDTGEVQRRTQIRLPHLPSHWTVTDAQIFPSREGPALQVMVRTADEQKLSLFAVRADSDAPDQPTAMRHEGASVAYWREGDMSYAITGGETPESLDSVAEGIAEDPATP